MSGTKLPCASLWPVKMGNASASCSEVAPRMSAVTGAAARCQFGGKVWLRRKEPMVEIDDCFVVPFAKMLVNEGGRKFSPELVELLGRMAYSRRNEISVNEAETRVAVKW